MTKKLFLSFYLLLSVFAAVYSQSLDVTELTSGFGQFTSYSVEGDQTWWWDDRYGYARISGYNNNTNLPNQDWLISPAYDLNGMMWASITFDHIINFDKTSEKEHNLTLWVSRSHIDGANPVDEDWHQLTGFIYPDGISWNKASSGNVVLPAEYLTSGVRLAFRYISTESSAATWEVFNFHLTASAGDVSPEPDPSQPNTGFEEYYQGIEGKCGEELLNALDAIISDHVMLSYDELRGDRARADIRPDGTIWDIYTTCSFHTRDYCGYNDVDTQIDCDCYNREHTLPKSWWGGSREVPMYTDLVHIFPTDKVANEKRGYYPYGETATVKWENEAGCKFGYHGTFGEVFEPADEYKGDLARVYFYMLTCYSDQSFIEGGRGSKQFYYNTTTHKGTFRPTARVMFLKWHHQDPVSDKERDRNDVIQKKQHNRNPFVDYPHLAEHIWGEKKDVPFYFVPKDVALDDTDDINYNVIVSEHQISLSNLYNSSITLRDICGRVVYHAVSSAYDHSFSVSRPGVYILTVDRHTIKIVIK